MRERRWFDETAANQPQVFWSSAYRDLVFDDELAIAATAYHLADLQRIVNAANDPLGSAGSALAAQGLAEPDGGLTQEDLLAFGYNACPDRLEDLVTGNAIQGHANAVSLGLGYVDHVRPDFAAADQFYCASEVYLCAAQ